MTDGPKCTECGSTDLWEVDCECEGEGCDECQGTGVIEGVAECADCGVEMEPDE